MNISYDKTNKTYVIGDIPYTKTEFLSYIQSDMLQSALATKSGSLDIEELSLNFNTGGKNLIITGAPGTGKSHDTDKEFGKNSIRCVFHNEYTNSDFLGMYKPVPTVSGGVTYEFLPGPFTLSLLHAFNMPSTMHNLIIEEINRADASAVFGEVFQLLDRKPNGCSEYSINISSELLTYFKENITSTDENLLDLIIKQKKIIIPSNLNIVATMNSSDQGVFTLDTAFKRRWIFRFQDINFDQCDHSGEALNYYGSKVTWKNFAKIINNYIVHNGLPEDRQLGPYFLKENEVSNEDIFSSKLLYYLWNDIAKYNKDLYFANANTFSELVRNYKEGFQIFCDNLHNKIVEIGE